MDFYVAIYTFFKEMYFSLLPLLLMCVILF